ncbi:MAG: type II toxin-antitoxin system VapC family toxin [Haliscomenobacter sp.]|nr:type II toxin-antitoxin system VapC family toxin [Haliscomenobacter sp.]MBK7477507.1 type II toxin-antitoxin system VapC family toxin [Haliscomenobacter sp.]MBK8878997.1 type II toxin-antitoxin system VapC family toxin [Haliscomenobacter sp.]
MILCDTNILIEFYKNNASIVQELKNIGQGNICISVITAAELLYGAINKEELRQIQKDLSHLRLIHIDDQIGKRFLQLMQDYSLSHKLHLPDALIAATAMHFGIPLFTLNVKDFKFIKGLDRYQRLGV